MLSVVLLGPQLWLVTPLNCPVEIRISGMDFIQSLHCVVLAKRCAARKKDSEALYHWQAAVAHHPAALNISKGFLEYLMQNDPHNRDRYMAAVEQTLWHLQIIRTNTEAKALAVRVLDHFGSDDGVVSLLMADGKAELSESDAVLYLMKSAVRSGNDLACQRAWRVLGSVAVNNSELGLYYSAWKLLGPSENTRKAEESLFWDNLTGSDRRGLALSLILRVHAHRLDLVRYEMSLRELVDLHQDELSQHTAYWCLLAGEWLL